MKEFHIVCNGLKLHAKLEKPEAEKCPLAIIFHGLTGHMEEEHIKAAADTFLKAGIAALRVDLFGHGQSEGEFGEHNLLKWIDNGLCVVNYAKSLDFVTDLYVTGHSQGGLLTVLIAGLKHDDFKAVIPLSPAINILDAARYGMFFGVKFDSEHIPDYFELEGAKINGDYFRVAQILHLEDFVKAYKGPVCIIHGDDDEAVPVQYAYKLQDMYSDCSLEIVHGDDHCFTRHLDVMVEKLAGFIEKVK